MQKYIFCSIHQNNRIFALQINRYISCFRKQLRNISSKIIMNLDTVFLEEAVMLHDIGIFLTHAPGIQCFGTEPYICHGYLGAGLVRKEGFPRHALVCERHTGAGLSLKDIMDQKLPVPHREMLPVSMEEQVICFADKFFSKTHLDREKTVEGARKSIAKYGDEGLQRFNNWCKLFL